MKDLCYYYFLFCNFFIISSKLIKDFFLRRLGQDYSADRISNVYPFNTGVVFLLNFISWFYPSLASNLLTFFIFIVKVKLSKGLPSPTYTAALQTFEAPAKI
jgi:hypothetical protein